EVRSADADVRIYDLEITGAEGVSGAHGILVTPNGGLPRLTLTRCKVTSNKGIGLASQGGDITVTQSVFTANNGGAISISADTFNIVGNVFLSNGGDMSSFGGVYIIVPQSAGS